MQSFNDKLYVTCTIWSYWQACVNMSQSDHMICINENLLLVDECQKKLFKTAYKVRKTSSDYILIWSLIKCLA